MTMRLAATSDIIKAVDEHTLATIRNNRPRLRSAELIAFEDREALVDSRLEDIRAIIESSIDEAALFDSDPLIVPETQDIIAVVPETQDIIAVVQEQIVKQIGQEANKATIASTSICELGLQSNEKLINAFQDLAIALSKDEFEIIRPRTSVSFDVGLQIMKQIMERNKTDDLYGALHEFLSDEELEIYAPPKAVSELKKFIEHENGKPDCRSRIRGEIRKVVEKLGFSIEAEVINSFMSTHGIAAELPAYLTAIQKDATALRLIDLRKIWDLEKGEILRVGGINISVDGLLSLMYEDAFDYLEAISGDEFAKISNEDIFQEIWGIQDLDVLGEIISNAEIIDRDSFDKFKYAFTNIQLTYLALKIYSNFSDTISKKLVEYLEERLDSAKSVFEAGLENSRNVYFFKDERLKGVKLVIAKPKEKSSIAIKALSKKFDSLRAKVFDADTRCSVIVPKEYFESAESAAYYGAIIFGELSQVFGTDFIIDRFRDSISGGGTNSYSNPDRRSIQATFLVRHVEHKSSADIPTVPRVRTIPIEFQIIPEMNPVAAKEDHDKYKKRQKKAAYSFLPGSRSFEDYFVDLLLAVENHIDVYKSEFPGVNKILEGAKKIAGDNMQIAPNSVMDNVQEILNILLGKDGVEMVEFIVEKAEADGTYEDLIKLLNLIVKEKIISDPPKEEKRQLNILRSYLVE